MRTANICTLKSQFSAYLRYVRNGEEVIICDRGVPFARIVPIELPEDYGTEKTRLVAAGILRPPIDPKPMDWKAFWALPRPKVSDEDMRGATEWSKGDR